MPRADASPEFVAALAQPVIRPALFVEAHFTTGPVYLWSGRGNIGALGKLWQGIGTMGSVSTIEEGSTVEARGITLTMSGFDASLLPLVLNDCEQGLPALVYFGLFDDNLQLIPNPVVAFAGRMDQPTIDVAGNTASLAIACESRLADMNTPAERRYNDSDQRRDYPNDAGFQWVPGVQEVTIYWGRVPSNPANS